MKTNKTIMEEFKKDFLTGELNTDFPVVAFYDEGMDSGDYWNGYKMERWLEQALKTVEDRERGLIKVKITDAIGAYTFNDSPLSLSEFLEELIAITTNNND